MQSRCWQILLLSALCAAPATGQVPPSLRLIGLLSNGSSTVVRQRICQPAMAVCQPSLGAPNGVAGGAAYDAGSGALWLTNGAELRRLDFAGCRELCATPVRLVLGPPAVASGLALAPARRQLFQLETRAGEAALSVLGLDACPPTTLGTCRLRTPSAAHAAGAIAVDERGGLVFWAFSRFGSPANPQNIVRVAAIDDPCTALCSFSVNSCSNNPMGPISAMTYDECSQVLCVSDGAQVALFVANQAQPCAFRASGCCTLPPSGNWHGFDIEPLHPRAVGSSCLGSSCRSCRSMRILADSDGAVGTVLTIELRGAPAQATYVLALNVGPCQVPGLPFACGNIHPGLSPPMILLPALVVPGLGCTGQVPIALPIPADYALCGAVFCSQGLLLCSANPAGIGLTGGLEVTIQ